MMKKKLRFVAMIVFLVGMVGLIGIKEGNAQSVYHPNSAFSKGNNLLVNGDFSDGFNGWLVQNDLGKPSNSSRVREENGSNYAYLLEPTTMVGVTMRQTVDVKGLKDVNLSFRSKNGPFANALLTVSFLNEEGKVIQTERTEINSNNVWKNTSVKYDVDNADKIIISFRAYRAFSLSVGDIVLTTN